MRYSQYSGIILQRRPYKEADEIITFWSWEEGKVSLLAKGARKSASKLRNTIIPLSWVNLTVVSGKPWPIVTGGRVIRSYNHISRSLNHISVVFCMFEMVLRATPDFQSNHEISQLLRQTLDLLEEQETVALEMLVVFRLRFFAALGYRLVLHECVDCRTSLHARTSNENDIKAESATPSPRTYWSHIALGAMCEDCARRFTDAQLMDAALHNFLHSSQTGSISAISRSKSGVRDAADRLLNEVFYSLTERNLRSNKFIKETNK